MRWGWGWGLSAAYRISDRLLLEDVGFMALTFVLCNLDTLFVVLGWVEVYNYGVDTCA